MRFEDARKYKSEIKTLYKSAFPRNERAPFFLLMCRTDNGRDNFYAVIDEDNFIGLVYTISKENLVYVFFLAVTEENRSKGYGSKILDQIKKMNPDKIITLAIEDTEDKSADNAVERMKRLSFYEKNGFKRLYIKVNEAGVVYELLGTNPAVTQADFFDLMRDWLGGVLFKLIYRKNEF